MAQLPQPGNKAYNKLWKICDSLSPERANTELQSYFTHTHNGGRGEGGEGGRGEGGAVGRNFGGV